MIRHYIIDGNNLIGKIPSIWKIQKKNPQLSREKLAFEIDRYFSGSKKKATLHFDGHPSTPIKINNAKIEYSFDDHADDKIKVEVSNSKNPKLIAVVSSDRSVMDFAKACSCTVIKSEVFANQMKSKEDKDDENKIIDNISDDEIKRLFGLE